MGAQLLVPRPLAVGDGDGRAFDHAYRLCLRGGLRVEQLARVLRAERQQLQYVPVAEPVVRQLAHGPHVAPHPQDLVVDVGRHFRPARGGRVEKRAVPLCREPLPALGRLPRLVAPERARREWVLRHRKREPVRLALWRVPYLERLRLYLQPLQLVAVVSRVGRSAQSWPSPAAGGS